MPALRVVTPDEVADARGDDDDQRVYREAMLANRRASQVTDIPTSARVGLERAALICEMLAATKGPIAKYYK